MDCMAGQRDAESISENLTCPECKSKSSRIQCTNPGHHDYWVHKCRYCCTPAKWFCFGNTHFCDKCHDRAGEFRNLDPSQLVPCKGALYFPLGIDHPPNGEEFVLSCKLCQEVQERDPEITKRIQKFESRQKIKRTLEKMFSIFFHLLHWMILLSSFGYNVFIAYQSSQSSFLSSFFWTLLKLIPLLLGVFIFVYQLFFYVFRRGRIRKPLTWSLLLPYVFLCVWIYMAGTISFTLFLMTKLLFFALFFARVFGLSSAIFFFHLGSNLRNVCYSSIFIACFELFYVILNCNFNPLSFVSKVAVIQFSFFILAYFVYIYTARYRYVCYFLLFYVAFYLILFICFFFLFRVAENLFLLIALLFVLLLFVIL